MATEIFGKFKTLFENMDSLDQKIQQHGLGFIRVMKLLDQSMSISNLTTKFLNDNIDNIDHDDVIQIYNLLEELQQRMNEVYPHYRDICGNMPGNAFGNSLDNFETIYHNVMTKLNTAVNEYDNMVSGPILKGGKRRRRKKCNTYKRKKHTYKRRKSRYNKHNKHKYI